MSKKDPLIKKSHYFYQKQLKKIEKKVGPKKEYKTESEFIRFLVDRD